MAVSVLEAPLSQHRTATLEYNFGLKLPAMIGPSEKLFYDKNFHFVFLTKLDLWPISERSQELK